MDRIGAEADLRRTLGTLRYLKGLSAHHAAAAATKAEPKAEPGPSSEQRRAAVKQQARPYKGVCAPECRLVLARLTVSSRASSLLARELPETRRWSTFHLLQQHWQLSMHAARRPSTLGGLPQSAELTLAAAGWGRRPHSLSHLPGGPRLGADGAAVRPHAVSALLHALVRPLGLSQQGEAAADCVRCLRCYWSGHFDGRAAQLPLMLPAVRRLPAGRLDALSDMSSRLCSLLDWSPRAAAVLAE